MVHSDLLYRYTQKLSTPKKPMTSSLHDPLQISLLFTPQVFTFTKNSHSSPSPPPPLPLEPRS